MAQDEGYPTIEFTPRFLDNLATGRFTAAELQRIYRALRLLDENERHPSLRVHQLRGHLAGRWSASASDELRLTFQRLPEGRKRLLTCTRHYAE